MHPGNRNPVLGEQQPRAPYSQSAILATCGLISRAAGLVVWFQGLLLVLLGPTVSPTSCLGSACSRPSFSHWTPVVSVEQRAGGNFFISLTLGRQGFFSRFQQPEVIVNLQFGGTQTCNWITFLELLRFLKTIQLEPGRRISR